MSDGAAYHFMPWARYGVLASISRPGAVPNQLPVDTLGQPPSGQPPAPPPLPARAPLPIKLRVNGVAADEVTVPLRLYGPGDVAGLDPREIVRTEPRHLTTDFPPHVFPFVEFDRPDFPWLFTPARATTGQRLRPWLVLAVVRKRLVTLSADPRRPLTVLECPAAELPDLRESWAWAHAQFAGSRTSDAVLPRELAQRPHQNVSRLLAPRKLEPRVGGADSSYYACLVPAFESGRKAGLGEPLSPADETTLADAWSVSSALPVTLPVYYHWEFSTGEEGDFEALVDRLRVFEELPDSAPRLMDVGRAGEVLPIVPGATLGVESALRAPRAPQPGWPNGLSRTFAQFQEDLRGVLEAPLRPGPTAPAVAPPIYGRWQAAGDGARGQTPLAPGAAPPWLRHLNLDPRYRAAAALGTRIVQQQQEQLVEAAWQQAGEAQAVNQWLRQKELAREVSQSIHEKRLGVLTSATLQQVASPVAAPAGAAAAARQRATGATGATGATAAPPSPPASLPPLAEAILSGPFRRLARPGGPLARTRLPAPLTLSVATAGAATAPTIPTTPTARPLGEQLTLLLRSATATATRRTAAPGTAAASAAQTDPRDELLALLDPQTTFASEAQARLVTGEPEAMTPRSDVLDPVRMTPSFPQPMYEPLRELFQEMLLPGLEKVPHNTLTVLAPNPAFIEAFMVGLNDELSRELLWREFPTDLQGTYFRQFWDVRGRLGPNPTAAERERLLDIPPIGRWQGALGANLPPDRGTRLLLLLIRGDLLVRYPNALIFAARASWSRNSAGAAVAPPVLPDGATPNWPVLRLSPTPGVTLLGFDLSASAPAGPAGGGQPPGDPGWFFVIQEHPTEPRFGLDSTAEALTAWRELAWPHVQTRADGSGYVAVAASTPRLVEAPPRRPSAKDLAVSWGQDAAHLAYITLRTAYRLEVHAGYWLPYDGASGSQLRSSQLRSSQLRGRPA